jgi:hypothetical protein
MLPRGDISVYHPPWRAPFSYCYMVISRPF